MYGLGILLWILCASALASETACDVCSMKISENSRQHFLVQAPALAKKPLHVCSVICLRKINTSLKPSTIEVSEFNHPQKFLKADKAFFLVKSEKIKGDAGPLAMPPIVAAFATKKEAESAQKKYGDGHIVLGLENALQSIGK